MARLFILSPAKSTGKRAQFILNPNAQFDAARQFWNGGLPLGELFAFLSGLYFRGKFAYARRFAAPPSGLAGVLVITPNRGLVSAEEIVTPADIEGFGNVPIDPSDARYAKPLSEHVKLLADQSEVCEIVFLGSISTGKYIDLLLPVLGKRLLFPIDFVGRGDMSRGGLLLRAVQSGTELPCVELLGAVRRGKRPPRLAPVSSRGAISPC